MRRKLMLSVMAAFMVLAFSLPIIAAPTPRRRICDHSLGTTVVDIWDINEAPICDGRCTLTYYLAHVYCDHCDADWYEESYQESHVTMCPNA